MRTYIGILLVFLLAIVFAPVVAFAQQSLNMDVVLEPQLDGAEATYNFSFSYPHQVYRYRVSCSDATTLKIQIADTGIAGDRWRATAYIYDKYPAKKVTTASGAYLVYSPVITMNDSGLTPLQVFVEVRYYRGLNDFSASGRIKFQTNGTCTPVVTEIGISDF